MSTPNNPEDPRVDDETWQEIVARLEATSGPQEDPAERESQEKNDGDASARTNRTYQPHPPGDDVPMSTPGAMPGSGPRDYEVAEPDEDEKYNPEVSMDLHSAHPVSVLAWVGLVASVIAVIVILLLRPNSSWWFIGTVIVFLGSAGLLLWRLPTERGQGDNGAQL